MSPLQSQMYTQYIIKLARYYSLISKPAQLSIACSFLLIFCPWKPGNEANIFMPNYLGIRPPPPPRVKVWYRDKYIHLMLLSSQNVLNLSTRLSRGDNGVWQLVARGNISNKSDSRRSSIHPTYATSPEWGFTFSVLTHHRCLKPTKMHLVRHKTLP